MKYIFFTFLSLLIIPVSHAQKFFRYKNKYNVLDTSVCGIGYHHYETLSDTLFKGITVSDKRFIGNEFGYFTISNKKASELMDIIVSPGNVCCDIFKVYYPPNKVVKDKERVNCENFVTENGVKLGMNLSDFFRKYPRQLFEIIYLGDYTIFKYNGDLKEVEDAIFFNYISLYKFKGTKLVGFVFGKYNDHFDYVKAVLENNPLYKKFNSIYSDNWFR